MEMKFGDVRTKKPKYKGMLTQAFYLPMRDGVKIAIDLSLPKELLDGEKIPAILSLTRYWRAIELRAPFKWFLKPEVLDPYYGGFQPFFTSHGYAVVQVDIRGTGASYGRWPHPWHHDATEDAREIVDWIIAQPWSNGKVGGHGISYLGTTAELLCTINHPAVKAVIPMFNHPDPYIDISYPGGVMNERFIASWGYMDHLLDRNIVPEEFGILGKLLVKGVKPVDGDDGRIQLNEAIDEHSNNGDVYEMAKSAIYRDEQLSGLALCIDDIAMHKYNNDLAKSNTIIFGWGSWMDAGTADAVLRRFNTYDNAQRAVIGAWEHGGRFHASPYLPSNLPADPQLPDQWREMKAFFDLHLNEQNEDNSAEKILYYYTIGEERWKSTKEWPPAGVKNQRWFLSTKNQLTLNQANDENGSDSYQVDFETSTGAHNRWWELGGLENKSVIYEDRADESKRLLTYTSSPITDDLEISGYPVVNLYISSTETDGVIFVYLEDVDEDGKVTYITEGELRLIHRKVREGRSPYQVQVPYHTFNKDDASPLVPNEVTRVSFGLLPISALIKKGHRIQVGLAGHDRGTFERIPLESQPVLTVYQSNQHPSWIDLPINKTT